MNGSKRRLEDCDAFEAVVEGEERVRKTSKLAQDGETANLGEGNHSHCNELYGPDSNLALASLLDFSSLTSADEISGRFSAIAQELLCSTMLSVVRDGIRTDLDILEVEFYLRKLHCHEDPFTHGSVEQERSGQWYFHRSPRRADTRTPGLPVTAAGGYRGGTRKGLDLTIGAPVVMQPPNTPVTVRGGVLLRTVRRRADSKVICGPSLLVDEILRLSDASSIEHLVNKTWNGDISALSQPVQARGAFMYLQKVAQDSSTSEHLTVYHSPRIGLDLSNPETTESVTHPRVVFVGKPYRYFTHPGLLAYKGRVQTFIGLHTMLMESKGYAEGSMELRKALRDMLGLAEQNVTKYIADYRSGYQVGKLKTFVGRSGKGVCQSASEYLKMMGTLRKVLV